MKVKLLDYNIDIMDIIKISEHHNKMLKSFKSNEIHSERRNCAGKLSYNRQLLYHFTECFLCSR